MRTPHLIGNARYEGSDRLLHKHLRPQMRLQHGRQRLRNQLIRHSFSVTLRVRDIAKRPTHFRAEIHVVGVFLEDHHHVFNRPGGS